MTASPLPKLTALPVQFVETSEGAILKRGCLEITVTGESASAVISTVLTLTADREATTEEICASFALPHREEVRKLVEQLVTRRILVPSAECSKAEALPESHMEIFYWHFGASAKAAGNRLSDKAITLLGINYISKQIEAALSAAGIENVQIVDFALLRNLRMFDEEGKLIDAQWTGKRPIAYETWLRQTSLRQAGCLVATSDVGSLGILSQWNRFCHDYNIDFFPVVLQDFVGYAGPLVIPHETACYECVQIRRNANCTNRGTKPQSDASAFQAQPFIGFHPSMASILGEIAAFELIKFYSGVLPKWNVGSIIEVDLMESALTTRKVLRAPRCSTCSALKNKAPVELLGQPTPSSDTVVA